MINFVAFSPTNNDDTTPLIPPFIGSDQPPDADFYSPYDSVHNSDDEDSQVNLNLLLVYSFKFEFQIF